MQFDEALRDRQAQAGAQRVLIDLTGEYTEALDRAWRAALRLQGLLVEGGIWERTASTIRHGIS